MRKLGLTWIISIGWFVLGSSAPITAQGQVIMMSREQAASILQRILEVGNYPGTLNWKTVEELPNQMEVDFYDTDLQTFLLEQGKNHVFTMKRLSPTWYEVKSPFNDAYLFPISHHHLEKDPSVESYELPDILVNAWSGRVVIELFPDLEKKTNTERGLCSLPILTKDQKRARVLEIMRTLYGDGDYEVTFEYHPSEDGLPDEEYWSAFLVYKVDPFTRARLLTRGALLINSRTGALEGGEFVNRPVTISTKPTISESEARQIGLNFIRRMSVTFQGWLHGYQGGKKIGNTLFVGHVDEGLFVEEDGLLEQHLIWMFPFTMTLSTGELSGGVIIVNAHTGEIMLDFSANLEVTRSQWRRRKHLIPKEYQIPYIIINNRIAWCWTPLRLVRGRLYIATRYVDNLGGYWDGQWIRSERSAFKVDTKECLRRYGQIFLPLRKVCQAIGIRLHWDNKWKVPVLRAEWLERKIYW